MTYPVCLSYFPDFVPITISWDPFGSYNNELLSLIILALQSNFKFFGGMSETANTLAWKSSKVYYAVC